MHHTLKKKPLRYRGPRRVRRLLQSGQPTRPEGLERGKPGGPLAALRPEELLDRDKASLDLFWLKDKSLTDLDNLPEPDELAEEIIENLEAGVESLLLLALRAG